VRRKNVFIKIDGKWQGTLLKENITELIKERSFKITDVIKEKLLTISSATVNRLLKEPRKKNKLHGISTTKAGKGLNQLIPIRVFFDWD